MIKRIIGFEWCSDTIKQQALLHGTRGTQLEGGAGLVNTTNVVEANQS